MIAERPLNVPVGTELTLLAALNAQVSVTGNANVGSIYAYAQLSNNQCSIFAGIETGSPFVGLLGQVAAGPITTVCATDRPDSSLFLSAGVSVWLPNGGDATVTVNFGNSALAEAVLTNEVPEPTAAALALTGLAALFFARRKRRR
jgi:hypothetical protein